MRIAVASFCTALAAFAAVPASADIVIRRDPGGAVSHYLQQAALIRDRGERIVVDGPCFSACTLILAVVPRERVCVTPRAVLGYHAAWTPGVDGRPVTAEQATRVLWQTYPEPVRRVIARKGGLTRKLIIVRGRELTSLYPACRAAPSNARTASSAPQRPRAAEARYAVAP
jgi:hypothetical protein